MLLPKITKVYGISYKVGHNKDSVAEWLRRWIANPLLFERESSNLSAVDILFQINLCTATALSIFSSKPSYRGLRFYTYLLPHSFIHMMPEMPYHIRDTVLVVYQIYFLLYKYFNLVLSIHIS